MYEQLQREFATLECQLLISGMMQSHFKSVGGQREIGVAEKHMAGKNHICRTDRSWRFTNTEHLVGRRKVEADWIW
jgi:hypothetical protein